MIGIFLINITPTHVLHMCDVIPYYSMTLQFFYFQCETNPYLIFTFHTHL